MVCPAWVIGGERKRERLQRSGWCPARANWRVGWEWLLWSSAKPAVRSEALLVLVLLTDV